MSFTAPGYKLVTTRILPSRITCVPDPLPSSLLGVDRIFNMHTVWVCLLHLAAICTLSHASLVGVGDASWGPRYGHSCVFVDNDMYVIGGKLANGTVLRDVWKSQVYPYNTGVKLAENALPAPRAFGSVIHVKGTNTIVYLGGNDGAGTSGGVWNTADGVAWSAQATPGWAPREKFGVFGTADPNTFFLFGGTVQGGNPYGDMWFTKNGGLSWYPYSHSVAGIEPRYGFAVAHNKEAVYIIGGIGSTGGAGVIFTDVWKATALGAYADWTQVSKAGTPVSRFGAFAFFSRSGALNVLGGSYGLTGTAVNSHTLSKWDGRMWCLPNDTNPLFGAGSVSVAYFGSAVYNDTFLILSGGFENRPSLRVSSSAYSLDISTDPSCIANQTQWMSMPSLPFSSQLSGSASVYVNDTLYVFGGTTDAYTSSVLRYMHNTGWTSITHDGSVFVPQFAPFVFYHQKSKSVYILGGFAAGGSQLTSLVRFRVDEETFETVVADLGFDYSWTGELTIRGDRVYFFLGANSRFSDYPFTVWNSAAEPSGPHWIERGSMYYYNESLWYAHVAPYGNVPSGKILRIKESDYVAGVNSFQAYGSDFPMYFGARGCVLSLGFIHGVPVSPPLATPHFLFFGGQSSYQTLDQEAYARIISADANQTWMAVDTMPVPRFGSGYQYINSPSAAASPDGKSISVVGGQIAAAGSSLSPAFFKYGPNACLSSPCVCGTCSPDTVLRCDCPPGFNGTFCEIGPNPCQSSPCLNGGTCTSTCEIFTCDCPRGFSGTNCGTETRPGLVSVGQASWGPRYGHSCVFVEDVLYVVGGKLPDDSVSRDVWISASFPFNTGVLLGVNSLPAPRAFGHALHSPGSVGFVYIGGNDGSTSTGDVWSTYDGSSWSTQAAPGWGPREQFGVFSTGVNGTFFLVGGLLYQGEEESLAYNDLWLTTDGGLTWTEHVRYGDFPARYGFAVASDNTGAAYLMGGIGGNGEIYTDVWRSTAQEEYYSWTQVSVAGTPQHRIGGAAFVFSSDTIHVLGGSYGRAGPAVNSHSMSKWSGRMWCLPEETNPLFVTGKLAVSYFGLAVYNRTYAILSGGISNSTLSADAYVLRDDDFACNRQQAQWSRLPPLTYEFNFGGVQGHSSVFVDNALYIFGGVDAFGVVTNSVLRYTSASGWTHVAHDGSAFGPRANHASLLHASTKCVYIFGGRDLFSEPSLSVLRFCVETETFEYVVVDLGINYGAWGFFGATIHENRIFMTGSSISMYSDYPFVGWYYAMPLSGLGEPYAVTEGALIYHDGMLFYATGQENYVKTGRILAISVSDFVESSAPFEPIEAPYGERTRFVGVLLPYIDFSLDVPAATNSTQVSASLFISSGDDDLSNQAAYAWDLNLFNRPWVQVVPSPVTRAQGGSSGSMASAAVNPDGKSVIISGGSYMNSISGNIFKYGPNACLDSPCVCGTCVPDLDYKCECPEGFNGTRCENMPNFCSSSPCQNGATCTNTCEGYACTCTTEYYGANCTLAHGCGRSAVCPYRKTCNPPPTNSNSSTDCFCVFKEAHGQFCDTGELRQYCDTEGGIFSSERNATEATVVWTDTESLLTMQDRVWPLDPLTVTMRVAVQDFVPDAALATISYRVSGSPSVRLFQMGFVKGDFAVTMNGYNRTAALCSSAIGGEFATGQNQFWMYTVSLNGTGGVRMYVNGLVVSECALGVPGPGEISTLGFSVGVGPRGTATWPHGDLIMPRFPVGHLADVRLYETKLSDSQIASMYFNQTYPDPARHNMSCAIDLRGSEPSGNFLLVCREGSTRPGDSFFFRGRETSFQPCNSTRTCATCAVTPTLDRPCFEDVNGVRQCDCLDSPFAPLCNAQCNENPCQRGGTCSLTSYNQYNCSCPSQWTGRNCSQDVDECKTGALVCPPSNVCMNTFGGYNCTACSSGSHVVDNECVPCGVGTAADPVQNTCIPCSPGKFGNATGLTLCYDCRPGHFSNEAMSTQCDPCPTGRYSEYAQEPVCRDCDVGRYANSTATRSCTPCPTGHYASQMQAVVCDECPSGTFADQTGGTSCLPCLPDTYSTGSGNSECEPCPVGTHGLNCSLGASSTGMQHSQNSSTGRGSSSNSVRVQEQSAALSLLLAAVVCICLL